MAYRRVVSPVQVLRGDKLTRAMVGIGMSFAARAAKEPNIEDTLIAASVEGLEEDDLRVVAMLVTWLGIHHAWINADRLIRALKSEKSPRARAFWTAIERWLGKDRRLARLGELYRGPRIDLLRAGTAFQIRRKGRDERFAEGPLRIPAGILRDRPSDVLSPPQLAKRHQTYRHRVLMGPTYRADMWAALEQDPSLTAAELARRTYGSFATAWQVKHDWELLAA